MPPLRLATITFQNFKSFESASIDLDQLTLLVGRNGSGKSNVLDAIAIASEATELPLTAVLGRRGGIHSVARREPMRGGSPLTQRPPMGLAFEFHNLHSAYGRTQESRAISRARYAFELESNRNLVTVRREQATVQFADGRVSFFDRNQVRVSSNLELFHGFKQEFFSKDALALPFLSALAELEVIPRALKTCATYSIDPTKLRELQEPDSGDKLAPDGSNAASVLNRLLAERSEELGRLIEIFGAIAPDMGNVRAQSIARKHLLRFTQRWSEDESIVLDSFNMSDGTLRAFGLLLALFQGPRFKFLAIEEPESSMHPAAVGSIVDVIRSMSERTQILITTHSPEVLEYCRPSESELRVVTWKDGQSRIGDVTGAAQTALQGHLVTAGDLQRMHVLDAPPLFEAPSDRQPSLFENPL